jgi:hypothetical protein
MGLVCISHTSPSITQSLNDDLFEVICLLRIGSIDAIKDL